MYVNLCMFMPYTLLVNIFLSYIFTFFLYQEFFSYILFVQFSLSTEVHFSAFPAYMRQNSWLALENGPATGLPTCTAKDVTFQVITSSSLAYIRALFEHIYKWTASVHRKVLSRQLGGCGALPGWPRLRKPAWGAATRNWAVCFPGDSFPAARGQAPWPRVGKACWTWPREEGNDLCWLETSREGAPSADGRHDWQTLLMFFCNVGSSR